MTDSPNANGGHSVFPVSLLSAISEVLEPSFAEGKYGQLQKHGKTETSATRVTDLTKLGYLAAKAKATMEPME
ncbi:hypothetical protein F3Y22_tig00112738pilonHSYRG00168 [Hibiscus syriacus]|uniref:Uncharacterized protein n=1 Tax=Hibiscus syriacus TaxID=106335 RepID=A0A6A2Y6I2_HIBSY|nr:hypothetical protein F3Y22_tig00112738pilonHSYRG00168 [Hibiscus syriacus]